MSGRLNIREVVALINNYFGPRVRVRGVTLASGVVDIILYDSFCFRITVDSQTGGFGMILQLPAGAATARLLGREFSLNNNRETIEESLALAEEYCRLRLTDKFLLIYDNLA
ncbi:hypothetical protein ACFVWR_10795 [Leifsonia sp. NPDC058292]|uniref:hypothetical protein n=1 Tax=Leifsonia sp. NPDC058292 TaxID=3346428 RepID=UPI0036DC2252